MKKTFDFLKYFDSFHYQPQLLFNKKNKYTTTCGGINSIILVIFIIIGLYFIIDLAFNDNVFEIVSKSEFYNNYDLINEVDEVDKTNTPKISNQHTNIIKSVRNETAINFTIIFQVKNKWNNSFLDNFSNFYRFEVYQTSSEELLEQINNVSIENCKFSNLKNYFCLNTKFYKNKNKATSYRIILKKICNDKDCNSNLDVISDSYLHLIYPLKILNFQSEYSSDDNTTFSVKYLLKEKNIPFFTNRPHLINDFFSPIYYKIDKNPFYYDFQETIYKNYIEHSRTEPFFVFQNNTKENDILFDLKLSLSDYYVLISISNDKIIVNLLPFVVIIFHILVKLLNYLQYILHENSFYYELSEAIIEVDYNLNSKTIKNKNEKSIERNSEIVESPISIRNLRRNYKDNIEVQEHKSQLENSNIADSNMIFVADNQKMKNFTLSEINKCNIKTFSNYLDNLDIDLPTIVRVNPAINTAEPNYNSNSQIREKNIETIVYNNNLKFSFGNSKNSDSNSASNKIDEFSFDEKNQIKKYNKQSSKEIINKDNMGMFIYKAMNKNENSSFSKVLKHESDNNINNNDDNESLSKRITQVIFNTFCFKKGNSPNFLNSVYYTSIDVIINKLIMADNFMSKSSVLMEKIVNNFQNILISHNADFIK